MKKLFIILAITLVSVSSFAQNNWERPNTPNAPQEEKRGLFDRNKTKVIDAKYLAGGVPEIDGKVTWQTSIVAKDKSAAQLYDAALAYFQKFVKEKEHLQNSQVAIVDKSAHKIVVRAQEWLVFENRALSLDQTKFNYALIVSCEDGKISMSLTNISYKYEEDRPSAMTITAEEWITDRETLNKKKNGFHKGGVKKFRMKTIDRVEQIFKGVEEALK